MLLMPGTPGLCQSTVGFDKFGFGLITVSRPGYARTPMTEELKKPEAQADLIMALMDHLGIEKLPILAASGAGVIGLRIAIQYPERVQALLLCCATTGQYDYPHLELYKAGEGRGAYGSPTIARIGATNMPKFAKMIMKGDIMTANEIKPDCVTDAQAEAQAALRVVDPYCAGVLGGLEYFAAIGGMYPESYDTMIVDMEYYKVVIPFD